jgi:hypothetical protein
MSVSKPRVSRRNRSPISLNRRLDHKLLGYGVAASAACVGVIALASPSEAQIVYTATNQTGETFALDLNNDGITDFTIRNSVSSGCLGPECVFQNLTVTPNGQNAVVGTYGDNFFAQGLPILANVGPAQNFRTGWIQMDRCKATQTSGYFSGSFERGTHYLGLAFSINGQTHYGWARFRVTVERRCNAHITLTGYAYETIPGEPIRAGETTNHKTSAAERPQATLGALALGSVSVEAWRRDDD